MNEWLSEERVWMSSIVTRCFGIGRQGEPIITVAKVERIAEILKSSLRMD